MPQRVIGAVVVACAMTGVASAQPETPSPSSTLPGRYLCEGTSPGGGSYELTLDVAIDGEIYRLLWSGEAATPTFGLGVIEGDRLSVSYVGDGFFGIAVYAVRADRLVGRWSAGQSPVETEHCQRRGDVPTDPSPPHRHHPRTDKEIVL